MKIAILLLATTLPGCWLLPSWCAEDCAKTGACGKEGLTCFARNDADCRQSELCRNAGACVMKDKMCVLGGSRPAFGERP